MPQSLKEFKSLQVLHDLHALKFEKFKSLQVLLDLNALKFERI